MALPTRPEAEELLNEYVGDEYQRLHAHMVAKAMEAYAEKYGEDKDLWYITGLLHDLDYFRHPEEHPGKSLEWFREWGYPEEMIHAVEAHAFGHNGFETEPETKLASALIACDELSGLMYAYSLMRPEGFQGMAVGKIKKKFKDKAFAAGVSRDDVNYGVEKLGVDFDEHVGLLLEVFKV